MKLDENCDWMNYGIEEELVEEKSSESLDRILRTRG